MVMMMMMMRMMAVVVVWYRVRVLKNVRRHVEISLISNKRIVPTFYLLIGPSVVMGVFSGLETRTLYKVFL